MKCNSYFTRSWTQTSDITLKAAWYGGILFDNPYYFLTQTRVTQRQRIGCCYFSLPWAGVHSFWFSVLQWILGCHAPYVTWVQDIFSFRFAYTPRSSFSARTCPYYSTLHRESLIKGRWRNQETFMQPIVVRPSKCFKFQCPPPLPPGFKFVLENARELPVYCW